MPAFALPLIVVSHATRQTVKPIERESENRWRDRRLGLGLHRGLRKKFGQIGVVDFTMVSRGYRNSAAPPHHCQTKGKWRDSP
jgi:hypothetical protein